ncbi:MAG: hypothetical protein HY699_22320 [Deltaproteobacteria bacterium]|nr:hypothetical protein [Deltaproteobacteria bacterium]
MDPAQQAELEAALTLMPRAIRTKLDRVGIKVHLKEWQALDLAERAQLRDAPCTTTGEAEEFAALADALVQRRTGKRPDRLPPASQP